MTELLWSDRPEMQERASALFRGFIDRARDHGSVDVRGLGSFVSRDGRVYFKVGPDLAACLNGRRANWLPADPVFAQLFAALRDGAPGTDVFPCPGVRFRKVKNPAMAGRFMLEVRIDVPGEVDRLTKLLPSRRLDLLRQAIGRRLVDIRRLTVEGPFPLPFSLRSGPTEFSFEGDVRHHFAVWGEQLSIVLLDDALEADDHGRIVSLSSTVSKGSLASLVGQRCDDVRWWRYRDEVESEEAKEAGVSYVFEGGDELFYCIYLHEDLDHDQLLFRTELQPARIETGFSTKSGERIL